jgi:hypothetical protein
LFEDVLHTRGHQCQPLDGRLRSAHGCEVEAEHEVAGDLVLLEHDRHRCRLVDRHVSPTAARGVVGDGPLELVGKADVVDHQAAGLVAEHAVHASNRLHEPVAAHGLVDVHGVQAGRVEAGQPHVAHDHDLEASSFSAITESTG